MIATLDAGVMPRLPSRQQDTGPASLSAPTPSGSRLGLRWFVVSTYAQAERRADQHLREQGYQTFLPLCIVTRRDRVLRTLTHRVEVPAFPAYLFIRFDSARDPWRPITNTPGVFRLLTSAAFIPQPVADAAIEALQASQELRRSIAPSGASWASGMPCSPVAGTPFAGHPAVVLSVDGRKASIGLLLFGELRTVSIAVSNLVARE